MSHDDHHASGRPVAAHPKLERLRALLQSGEVDTLIVAFTDMQGRLMGKRVNGAAFLDGVVDHGAHICISVNYF